MERHMTLTTIEEFTALALDNGYTSPEFAVFRKDFPSVFGLGCSVHFDPHSITVCRPSPVEEFNFAGVFPSMSDADEMLNECFLHSTELAELHAMWDDLQKSGEGVRCGALESTGHHHRESSRLVLKYP